MDSGSVISSLCVHTANVGSGIAGIACESVFHEYKTSLDRQNTLSSQRPPSRSEPPNTSSTSTLTRSSSILHRSLSLLRPRSSRKEILRSNTFTPSTRPFDPARAYSFDIHNEELETRNPQRREREPEEKERDELVPSIKNKNESTTSSLAIPTETTHKPLRQSVLGKRPYTSSAVALPSTSPEAEQSTQKRTSLQRKASSLFSAYGRNTPSVFSDRSDKPLIQSSRQALGRNRLVKRSTSQKTDLQSRSNLGLGSYSFRRPATSHQRRIASEGHQSSLGPATGGFEKPDIDFAAARPRSQTFDFNQASSQLERQKVETKRSFTKLGGFVDSNASRVSDITIIKMPASSVKSTPKKSKSPVMSKSESDRERSSTATPTPGTPRRNVSATQQRQPNGVDSETVQNSDPDAALSSKTSSKRPAGDHKIKVMKVRRRTTGTTMSELSSSSPTQVAPRATSYTAAFRTPDTRTPSSRVVSDSSIRPGSSYTADHLFTNSSNSDHRSRVSSAQTSTLGGSETDGVGYDERSDTMYDSIRTGATSMSLARSKHLEDIFGDHDRLEDDLADIQQKLTDFSGLNDPRYIVREEDELDSDSGGFEDSFQREDGEAAAFTSNTLSSRLHTNESPRYLDSNVSTPSKSKGWDTQMLDWSEPREDMTLALQRPSTMHGAHNDRTSRNEVRGLPPPHLRSHSVPLPLGKPGPPVNDITKLDAWSLGANGATEDWDTDFVFDDPIDSSIDSLTSDDGLAPKVTVQVPTAILQTQSSVHGQFGQVKELTLLVEELRDLHAYASRAGLLSDPKHAETWSEAEGIIHLADVDDDVPRPSAQIESPSLAAFDFDNDVDAWRLTDSNATQTQSPISTVMPSTPRRRAESTVSISISSEHQAQAKHVLSHIQPSKTIPSIPTSPSTPGYAFDSPARPSTATASATATGTSQSANATASATEKKFPFDTASLRDLVSRASHIAKTLRDVVWVHDHPGQTQATQGLLGADLNGQGSATPVRSSSLRQPPEFSRIFTERDDSVRRSPLSLRNESVGVGVGVGQAQAQAQGGSPMRGVEMG